VAPLVVTMATDDDTDRYYFVWRRATLFGTTRLIRANYVLDTAVK